MANSTEWAHVDAHASTTTAYQLFTEDPDDHRLDLENGRWNIAIFAGDGVAIYADSPDDLRRWLQARLDEVEQVIAGRAHDAAEGTVYLTGNKLADGPKIAETASDGIWDYLEALETQSTPFDATSADEAPLLIAVNKHGEVEHLAGPIYDES